MKKRESLILDDAYYKFDTQANAAVFEKESYSHNRADSIEWARRRCKENTEIQEYMFTLRRQFRERLGREFPSDAVLSPMLQEGEDLNHFLVLIGRFAEDNRNPALQQMALFYAEKLKIDLNLDLAPSFFEAKRAFNDPPQKRTLKIPGKKS